MRRYAASQLLSTNGIGRSGVLAEREPALLGFLEHVIGRLDLLEPLGRLGVAGIGVGVRFLDHPPVSGLDRLEVGIAVDLDYQGLIVPVIRDADSKRLRAIAREIHDLAGRAKSKKLGPDEISGGTFTISNNGSAGSVLTMPVINQPQVAILSTDAINRKPVVVSGADGSEAIAIHPVGNLAMSWDHRAFDGAYAANFLKRIKEILETRDWSSEV